MIFNKVTISYLNMKAGCDVTTPAGATILSHDIESKTGERLSANTIKRLTGVIEYQNKPRISTLNIIARYLGHSSWEGFERALKKGSSIFGDFYPFVEICKLKKDALLSFRWDPDREITLRHTQGCKCEVMRSVNSKLMPGDQLVMSQLAERFPFYVKDVVRGSEHLGSYCAATETGISDLKID